MVLDFDTAFTRLLGHEGRYVNDPNDPGGETNWGVSKRSYPEADIKNLTREQAKQIYLTDFWRRIHADELYDGVAWQAFDFAVNSGIETAVRKLQSALGVADDGHWGPVTEAAAKKMSETDQIMRYLGKRLDYMTRLRTWEHHGKGWARRIAGNLLYGAEDS
ncbi:MAG TPA: glycosyl hydrolase 108 family protein [Phycisphaerae bacterium]|nr:glycosyl hydrolase 108 family protein [Phycisphaerae bacterium]